MKFVYAAVLALMANIALANSPTIIDVRSLEEFNQGHVANASNIPHTKITDQIESVTSNKDADIILYCRSGRRAGLAKAALEDMGYTNVKNLKTLDATKAFIERN